MPQLNCGVNFVVVQAPDGVKGAKGEKGAVGVLGMKGKMV